MKNKILILGSILFLSASIFSGCQSSATKVENAEDDVHEDQIDLADSKSDLYKIRLDTISTYDQFKIEAEKMIVTQDKNIEEFKAKLVENKKDVKSDYNKKIVDLENKNSDLKNKLADYKDDGQEKWMSFKTEFNHDMNEFGKAFNNLTVENVN